MTKKQQNRTSGFARRSLSVVLTVMIVLSMLVVMLAATSLSASATIGYWNIAGNFNDWGNSLSNSNYRINSGSGGSVTIPMTASSIKFKACAYENDSWSWCGNTSGSLNLDTEGLLEWSAGNDIQCSLPANTVSVTFTIIVRDGKNYVKVHANTSGGTDPTTPTPTPTGNEFVAKVNESNSANSKDNIFWADAVYYDYLSDKELTAGWLNPDHVGTSNFNGNIDEWYPFYNFNRNVVKSAADSNSSWSSPLYFGNFCNTYNAYDTSHHPGVSNGFNDATGSYNVTRFNYAANNSNGVYDMYTSVQGLMGSSLQNGQLVTADGMVAPYFNAQALGDYAKVVNSKFPFRKSEINTGSGKYMRYEFDSTNARDNVYFDWNGSTPTAVNYGAGTSYGVKDGIKEFMNTESGYGIFPFNRTGTGNGGNNQLDYGFGIRMDMKFRVPNNTEVTFDFSGDDDLWMYITDTTDNSSQLVLDMGGSHKESEGVVNFTTKKSTVYKVDNPSASNKDIWIMDSSSWGNVVIYAWDDSGHNDWYYGQKDSNLYRFRDNLTGANTGKPLSEMTHFLFAKNTNFDGNSGDLNISDRAGKCSYTDNIGYTNTDHVVGGHCEEVTTSFNFDPSHTYIMSIFYMERGLIESNCKMGFTLTPLGNNFIVTEQIDTSPVNKGLRDVVTGLSEFGFNTYKDGSIVSDDEYDDFTLGNNEKVEISDSVLPMRSNVKIKQYAPQNSFLTYDTSWEYYDNLTSALLSSGTGVTSNEQTTITNENTLINAENDDYEFAELRVDYRNTPRITDVKITKEVANYDSLPADMQDDEFTATILLQLSSDMQPTAYNDLETSQGEIDFASGGKITLKHGEYVTVYNVPVGTRISVVEDTDPAYQQVGGDGVITDSDQNGQADTDIAIVNTSFGSIYNEVAGTKQLDGYNYTGDLFTFCIEGVQKFAGESDDIIDTSAMTPLSTSDVTAGAFKLGDKNNAASDADALLITGPGVYRYHLYEQQPENPDFQIVGSEYLVKLNVSLTQDGTGKPVLTADDPIFIPYSSASHTMTAADFDKAPVQEPVFNNAIHTGSVKVEKKDQSGNLLQSIEFRVYKVDSGIKGILDDTSKSEGEQYDAIKQYCTSGNIAYASGVTNSSGIAQFNNLQIYTDDFLDAHTLNGVLSLSSTDTFEYQDYILIEASGPSDYAINRTINKFRFPINGSYDFTFSGADAYINGLIKNPSSGGVHQILYIGVGIVMLAAVMLATYMLYMKKRSLAFIGLNRYKGRHFIDNSGDGRKHK